MAVDLRQVIDALNESLTEAARVVRELKLGVSAEVEIAEGALLVWGPLEGTGGRRLHVRNGDRVHNGFEDVSLEMRVQAAEAVPALVEMLRAERARRGDEIEETASELLSYLGELLDVQDGR